MDTKKRITDSGLYLMVEGNRRKRIEKLPIRYVFVTWVMK